MIDWVHPRVSLHSHLVYKYLFRSYDFFVDKNIFKKPVFKEMEPLIKGIISQTAIEVGRW
jgi:hypothetical protein